MIIDDKFLGSAIAKLRKLLSMTQAGLTERTGLSTIPQIEQGVKRVSLKSLNTIADALELPAGCLALLGTTIGDTRFRDALQSQQRLVLHAFADTHRIEMDRVWDRFPGLFGSEESTEAVVADAAEASSKVSE